jgi:hypothetical protein
MLLNLFFHKGLLIRAEYCHDLRMGGFTVFHGKCFEDQEASQILIKNIRIFDGTVAKLSSAMAASSCRA